ncbi:hypothetical protein BRADI_1g63083v3 [Brachypodium distachyon]|uniref:Uncharacterized protein n=1 Tax=Brachypodium distachyon TaxID=15368 RepID=A0A2K2DT48_BRADI|nr:hypothetical protein BRADI_1g63083v3 [Brachypodium distachyon]
MLLTLDRKLQSVLLFPGDNIAVKEGCKVRKKSGTLQFASSISSIDGNSTRTRRMFGGFWLRYFSEGFSSITYCRLLFATIKYIFTSI